MEEPKRKRGRKPKVPNAESMEFQFTSPGPSTATPAANDVVSASAAELTEGSPSLPRRGRGRPRKIVNHVEKSPERRSSRFLESSNGDAKHVVVPDAPPSWESVARLVPSMDAVVKVFCVHTEPNFSLPWQRKRQYSSSSSGFIIGGRRVLTNAHSVEHHTQVKLKKRGSDTKYLATVLAIGTECDIGLCLSLFWDVFFLLIIIFSVLCKAICDLCNTNISQISNS